MTRKHSEETKRKIAEGVRRYWANNKDTDPRVGQVFSDETKETMKESENSGRFKKVQVSYNKGKTASGKNKAK